MIKAKPKLREFRYKPLQFKEELDNLFISNSATGEKIWGPTRDEPIPIDEGPITTDGDHDMGSEFMEPFNTTILSDATDIVDELKQAN